MQLNLDEVWANVRDAETEDLLDRATVYRAEMEAAALDIIDAELRRRGMNGVALEAHERERMREILLDAAGLPVKCTFCHRPATSRGWGWHRMWRKLPVFPRPMAWCGVHRPNH